MITNVTIKIILVPGKTLEVSYDEGATLASVLERANVTVNPAVDVISVNSETVEPLDWETKHVSGGVIIIAKGAKAKAPTPLMRNAERFLKENGYCLVPGKGDHKKYVCSDLPPIILNSAKQDPKQLDLASAKQMARHFGKSLHELNEMLV